MDGNEVQLGKWLNPVAWLTARLRERITAGELQPGDLLSSERNIVQATGIGRHHVRRALALLEKEGWIERRHGHGTRVTGLDRTKQSVTVAVATMLGGGTGEGQLLMDGIADRLRVAGVGFDFFRIHTTPDRLTGQTSRVIRPDEVARLTDRYAGVLFIEMTSPDAVAPAVDLERRRCPVVAANMEGNLCVSGTRVDHGEIFRKATETLLALGHRRIAYVGNPPQMLFYGRALQGYRTALDRAGIAWDDSRAVFAPSSDSLGAYLAARPVLDSAQPPTAIVAGRDFLARGVCQAIEERGLRLGHDVSVISFDDVSWHVEPSFLTTFHEPCFEMGNGAADMLLERMSRGWRPLEHRTYDAPLVVRRTAGPPPGGAPLSIPVALPDAVRHEAHRPEGRQETP